MNLQALRLPLSDTGLALLVWLPLRLAGCRWTRRMASCTWRARSGVISAWPSNAARSAKEIAGR